jgi:hypothetical protein
MYLVYLDDRKLISGEQIRGLSLLVHRVDPALEIEVTSRKIVVEFFFCLLFIFMDSLSITQRRQVSEAKGPSRSKDCLCV